MNIVELYLNDSADVVTVETGTKVTARVFNWSDYHQTDSFMRVQMVDD